MSNNTYTHITHSSIKPYINDYSSILILGSFPSVKTREVGFYYGHKQNRFFKVLAAIYNEDIPLSIEEKKALLSKHHIALYDVIEECDIIGSSDASIKNVVPINIKEIISSYPNIHTIILNGGLAKKLFDQYLLEDVPPYINVKYAPSTSPMNARMSLDELIAKYKETVFEK